MVQYAKTNENNDLGKLLLGGLAAWGLYELFAGEKKDTINYRLFHRGRLVYEGVCYEDRFFERLLEHERCGKRFDNFTKSVLKTRSLALSHEEIRIRKSKPKYNIHHNW